MPAGENCRRQRASSPSTQSSRIWPWMSSAAASAASTPGSVSTAAASSPTAIIAHVTTLGVTRVGTSRCVTYGEKRRTYSRPAQCSPLLRANSDGGWVVARSSAIEGADEAADTLAHPPLVEREVLEHGEAVGPRARRVQHGRRELLLAEPEVARQPRQAVAPQAAVDSRRHRLVAAQVGREQRGGASELPVAGRARKQVVDRVQDLVV